MRDEEIFVRDGGGDVGKDLVPIVRSGSDHLIEAAARDEIDERLVAGLRSVVPINDHGGPARGPGQQRRDRGIVFDAVVPEHHARARRRDQRVHRGDVIGVGTALAGLLHVRGRRPKAERCGLVRTDMKERRIWNCRQLLRHDAREIVARHRRSRREKEAVREFGGRRVLLDAEHAVHVRERLLFRNQSDVKATRVSVEFVQLRGRDAVERSRQRIRRRYEDVFHVRRVAVHLKRGDGANAFLEIPHRRKRSAGDVVGKDSPRQRGPVRNRHAGHGPRRDGAPRELRERHDRVERAGRASRLDANSRTSNVQAIFLRPHCGHDRRGDVGIARARARNGDAQGRPALGEQFASATVEIGGDGSREARRAARRDRNPSRLRQEVERIGAPRRA